jgi:peptidoglycan/xylan/chitin deacetylase (PgdA/CDA1 family)
MKKKNVLFIISVLFFVCFALVSAVAVGGFFEKTATAAALKIGEKQDGAELKTDEKKGGIELPILMYHSTFTGDIGKYNVVPKLFESDLKYLRDNGYTTVTVREVLDYRDGKGRLPEKPIMLTFDDGYYTNYLYAFPLLKKYSAKCVMSVIGACIDENYVAGTRNSHAHINYEQIKEMNDSGLVEFQNHTYNLHRRSKNVRGMNRIKGESMTAYAERIGADLKKLNDCLLTRTGITCTAVAFPFGYYTKGDTVKVIEKFGFSVSFCCTEGKNRLEKGGSLQLLKRFNRSGGTNSAEFFKRKGIC